MKSVIVSNLSTIVIFGLVFLGCNGDNDSPATNTGSVIELKNITNNSSWEPDLDLDENGSAFIVGSQNEKSSPEGTLDLSKFRVAVWSAGSNELPTKLEIIGDPRICVAGDNVFISGLGLEGAESQLALVVGKIVGEKFVLQETKFPIINQDSDFSVDKPELAVSTDGKKIFITFIGFIGDDSNESGVFLTKSLDGGNTFSPPVVISSFTGELLFINEMVYKQGKLSLKTIRTPATLENEPVRYPNTFSHYLLTSVDDGENWTLSSPFASFTVTSESYQKDFDHLGSTDIDASGAFYAVGIDNSSSTTPAIVVKKSLDGASWSTVYNYTATSTKIQHPHIAIENNDIALAWVDNSIAGRSNMFVKYSKDKGATWTDPIRVSEFSGRPFQDKDGFGGFYGDYGRIRIKNNQIHLTWAESFLQTRSPDKDASSFYRKIEIK